MKMNTVTTRQQARMAEQTRRTIFSAVLPEDENEKDIVPPVTPDKQKRVSTVSKRKISKAESENTASSKKKSNTIGTKRAKTTTANKDEKVESIAAAATTPIREAAKPSREALATTPNTKRTRGIAITASAPVTPDHSLSSSIGTTLVPSPTKQRDKAAPTTSIGSNTKSKGQKTQASPKKTSPTKNKQERSPPKEVWEAVYRLVEELRSDRTAPVDTDGSEALPQRHLGDETYRFQVLVALMLSSQTKDAVVGDAMRKLQVHGLTIDNIRATSFEALNQLIAKVGFHNTKAKNILQVVEILHTEYNGDIPPTARQMIDALPGVGPKMAFIVENVAWGRCTGIGVDTHMHRMFNQLKWVDSKQPEQTRLQLESWLPREYWPSVNLLWVGMGQEVQQYPDKVLRKALDCSRPRDALQLLKRLGMDHHKVGTKMGWTEEIEAMKK